MGVEIFGWLNLKIQVEVEELDVSIILIRF
jgi:hypothetical protein